MTSGPWQAGGSLADPESLPLYAPSVLDGFGRTLVAAPHPDDESLGCGGVIALLREAGCDLHVLFISDGTLSHPNSRRYPAPALRALREREAAEALSALCVAAGAATFLGLRDGSVPDAASDGFGDAVAIVRAHIQTFAPTTILLPWRRDPHPDHRATSGIVRAAVASLPVRLVEYPIWAWERATGEDLPQPGEAHGWRLDIRSVQAQKQAAIACHRSQVTHMIDDDPDGFWLSPEVLAHFAHPWEVFLEANP